MFPLIVTVLDRDSSRGYCSPYKGLLVSGGTTPCVSGIRSMIAGIFLIEGVLQSSLLRTVRIRGQYPKVVRDLPNIRRYFLIQGVLNWSLWEP